MTRDIAVVLSLGMLLMLFAPRWKDSQAFELSPQGTKLEQVTSQQREPWYWRWMLELTQGGIRHFSHPVHEEITHRIYDCDADQAYCAKVDIEFAPQAVLYGIRWNDDPPFGLSAGQATNTSCKVGETVRLITQPRCWRQLFNDAEKGAATGKIYDGASGAALVYRVHFGDLQFLHSMASSEGESAGETLRRILIWAEFTWRLAVGEYSLGTVLKDVQVQGLSELIARPDWRVQDLFTYGNPRVRSSIKDVAFGSALHMIQDSFAKGHTERLEPTFNGTCATSGAEQHLAPGLIREFHAYNHQDHGKHSEYDGRAQLMEHIANTRPHVVSVGRALREYFENGTAWNIVKPYFECVFAVERLDRQEPATRFDRTMSRIAGLSPARASLQRGAGTWPVLSSRAPVLVK